MEPSRPKFAMTLSMKLASIFVVALISMAIIGWIAVTGSKSTSAETESTIEHRFQQMVIIGDLRGSFVLVDALLKKAPLELDSSILESDRREFRRSATELKRNLKEFQANSRSTDGSGTKSAIIEDMVAALDDFTAEGEKVYENSLQFAQREAYEVLNGGAAKARDRVEGAIRDFSGIARSEAGAFVEKIVKSRDRLTWTTFVIAGVLFLVVLIMTSVVVGAASRALRAVRAITGVTGSLADGDMDVQIPGRDRSDEIGAMARSLEQIRSVGLKAARAQSSLDDASSPMMIVDMDGTVIFANKAMIRLEEESGAALGSELKGFGKGDLTDVHFDQLHNASSMNNMRLMESQTPVSARISAGGLTIDLTASPVFNDQGDRLGSVVEWNDRTAQVAVEKEIAGIVHAATEGNFSQRLREADKDGFMADLARGMNELLDVVDNGLNQVVKVVGAMAEGDMTRRMQGNHKGAFAKLKTDVDRMSDQMGEIVGRIAAVTGTVQLATNEISAGITDLSARTEHQASSLEETTASMEELSATVRQNAGNAQEANEVATTARNMATSGGDIVERTVAAMSGIEESSRKITDIVGLIQEIAFQTNLLALNASVEAARAGESGRGFAVVANEVRALAQRAASASKDIKELIVNSDTQVQDGVKLVGEAGSALGEIVTSVKKVADYVSEIASASHEQTSGIDQVSNAIIGMDEMTQQNASLVEETTGGIASAQLQMEELQRTVAFFKTAAQPKSVAPRTAEADDMPVASPVLQQQQNLARKVTGSAAAISPAESVWEEF